jgi:hypothetical protein
MAIFVTDLVLEFSFITLLFCVFYKTFLSPTSGVTPAFKFIPCFNFVTFRVHCALPANNLFHAQFYEQCNGVHVTNGADAMLPTQRDYR